MLSCLKHPVPGGAGAEISPNPSPVPPVQQDFGTKRGPYAGLMDKADRPGRPDRQIRGGTGLISVSCNLLAQVQTVGCHSGGGSYGMFYLLKAYFLSHVHFPAAYIPLPE